MTIFKQKTSNPVRDRFLEEARKHLGYKCRPGGLSDFAIRTGYKGEALPWSGSFIDCVARDGELFLPACVYTPSGLGEFIADGRVVNTPEPGDIVFYNFPTTIQFGMPHCGIVARVDEYMQTGSFTAIEAQVNSGLPRGSNDKTGVFERTRHRYDVIAFARPNFKVWPGADTKKQTGSILVKVRNAKPGKRHSDVEHVQAALVRMCNLKDFKTGEFDSRTTEAFMRWQRQIGYVYPDCNGVPDDSSLKILGEKSGLFNIVSENQS